MQPITPGESDERGDLQAAVEDLIAKVSGGKALEAFGRYYADDVTMQENEQPPRRRFAWGFRQDEALWVALVYKVYRLHHNKLMPQIGGRELCQSAHGSGQPGTVSPIC
jgi:hypothetical protein